MNDIKGKIILIIGSSGTGKSTMIDMFKEKHNNYIYPLSATTRKKRKDEINKESYYFLSKKEFKEKINNNEFLEYTQIHNNTYYGTLKNEIIENLKKGNMLIKDINYEGVISIQKIIPKNNLITIFILPFNKNKLIERIKQRSNITKKEIKDRVNSIEKETEFAKECDIQIKLINNDIKKSFQIFEKTILNIVNKKN